MRNKAFFGLASIEEVFKAKSKAGGSVFHI